jgi:hypothetical protein
MDDFTSNILNDSKNEWSILLINLITSHIIDGFRSIFNESLQLCQSNDEPDKYLMTYQNLLSRIPNWNQSIIDSEKERIMVKSKCSYLEDLVTCVHIIQLKLLSCVRVGTENKKINIDIPDFTFFLHKIYINIARKLYSNIYLFELDIPPLEQQRRNREFELLVQTSIMNTIRDNLPVEQLLRQYIDETQEVDVNKVETIIDNKMLNEPEEPKIEPKFERPRERPFVKPFIKPEPFEKPFEKPEPFVKPFEKPFEMNEEIIELPDIVQEKTNTIRFHPDVQDNSELKIGEEIKLDLHAESLDVLDLGIEEIL